MAEKETKSLGEIAHDAYGDHLMGNGGSHMPWEHISDEHKAAWQAAVEAVKKAK